MPRYGDQGREPERLPDWVLGGARRRLVFERLSETRGWAAIELAEAVGAGEAWTFEIYRLLRSAEALEEVARGTYRLNRNHPLAGALGRLVDALGPYEDLPVDRPPSRRS